MENRIVIYVIYIMVFLCLILSCAFNGHEVRVNGRIIPNFYSYKSKEVKAVLKKIGMIDSFSFLLGRNNLGTELHFLPRSSEDNRLLVLNLDGTFEIRGFPTRPSIPDDAKIDLSGDYFFRRSGHNETEVGSIKNPSKTYKLSHFVGRRIFSNGGKIYVFGYDPDRDKRCPDDPRFFCVRTPEIICYILKFKNSDFVIQEKIFIKRPSSGPSPFGVVDNSLFSDDVLLVDVYDVPNASQWYLFNLKKKRMKKVGCAKPYGFFLAGDILKSIEDKN